jgi:hypothetical protein
MWLKYINSINACSLRRLLYKYTQEKEKQIYVHMLSPECRAKFTA